MGEEMRLQKYLALCGVASRRAAEDMIAQGRVSVNGIIVKTFGLKVIPGKDVVFVDQKQVAPAEQKVYIMLHKPRGYVTTVKDNFNRKTVLDLLPSELGRIYPVGRLDYDTEGLLLLTNDGDFTYRLTHPRHEVTKTYLAIVAGRPTDEALQTMQKGVLIDGRKTRPAQVMVKGTGEKNTTLQITIHEGRNRQVRKMCAAVGYDVIRLRRIAEGSLRLGNLPVGNWRHLTQKELAALGGNNADN